MAEPGESLWQAMLARASSPSDQPFMWRSSDGKASLSCPALGRPVLGPGWCAEDQRAFELFAPLLGPGRLAIAQLGQSLDGRIATASGDSYYINGRVMRAHLHRLRALVDAVIIGAGTAVTDRPALSVRHCPGPSPVPVIIDPGARVPLAGPLFDPEKTPRLIIVHTDRAPRHDWPTHVEGLRLRPEAASSALGLAPSAVLDALAGRGLERVLIEGGGVTVSRFIDDRALDRLHLLIAPLLIGSGPSGLNLRPIDRLAETRRRAMRSYPLADELLVDVDLRARD
jgi:riboflavin-specific deaminase-like protein